MNTYQTFLSKKIQLNENTFLFQFKISDGQKIFFNPGQYVMMLVENQTRLYSIASSNKITDSFELLIELVDGGFASGYLKKLQEGSTVIFRGPAGFFKIHDTTKPMFFIATGTGYAPIRSMLLSQIDSMREPVYLYWGLKYFHDVYLIQELDDLKIRKREFSYFICLSREESSDFFSRPFVLRGHVTDYLKSFPDNFKKACHFYICGGRKMVEDVTNLLLSIGVEKEKLIFEKY